MPGELLNFKMRAERATKIWGRGREKYRERGKNRKKRVNVTKGMQHREDREDREDRLKKGASP